jgi:D-sedoheptulose 7-phosphate isomerase
MGMKTVALTGNDGGAIGKMVDFPLVVPSTSTPRIQEAHILIGHILCEMVEHSLFFKVNP